MSIMNRLNPKISSLESEMLQLELSNFGLSPTDWVIKKESKYFYKIENRNDPDFYFNGMTKATRRRTKWNRIILKSI